MESTRPIRALLRGLDALTVLNSRDGVTVSEVAQEVRLPRTTVYRILETLCGSGFVSRDTLDERYRLTSLVRGISHGFTDEAWVESIALPCIEELAREIVWPVAVSTLSGTTMVVRAATDHRTPLAVERRSAGSRLALLTSAAGRVHLAFCDPSQRDTLIDRLAPSQRAEVLRLCADIKSQGHATVARTRRLDDEVSLGVPVQLQDRLLACLTVRFMSSAVSGGSGLERFLPKLHLCAARMGALLSESEG